MKTTKLTIGILSFLLLGFSFDTAAQNRIRPSQKAVVTQHLGADTKITFEFSRPGVKGRTVWGGIVPWGLAEGNQYSNNKPFPWRAGANENSTIEINQDIKVNGQALAAGKYSIHMIPAKGEDWVVIFNKNSSLWGSYQYDKSDDALRIMVSPEEAPHCEWLTFGVDDITNTSATAFLHWEKLKVPFKVEL